MKRGASDGRRAGPEHQLGLEGAFAAPATKPQRPHRFEDFDLQGSHPGAGAIEGGPTRSQGGDLLAVNDHAQGSVDHPRLGYTPKVAAKYREASVL